MAVYSLDGFGQRAILAMVRLVSNCLAFKTSLEETIIISDLMMVGIFSGWFRPKSNTRDRYLIVRTL